MKFLKLATAGAFALAFTGMASAQTYLYITGSTAYRAQTTRAIAGMLGANPGTGDTTFTIPQSGGYVWESSSGAANVTAANAAMFKGKIGGLVGGASVIVKTSWSGSAAGVQTVAGNGFTVNFLPDVGSTGSDHYTFPTDGSGLSAGVADPRSGVAIHDAEAPEVSMSDTRQTTTPFNGSFAGHTYANLVDASTAATGVGVVPFVWVASDVANSTLSAGDKAKVVAGLKNMTPQLAVACWNSLGGLPLSLFSGLPADSGILIVPTGRDPDSGTRLTAFAESGIGVAATVHQYNPATGAEYDPQTINGIDLDAGQGGESSGGTLASKMGANSLTAVYVSYLSTGDFNTLSGLGGTQLTYNGVTQSTQAIQEGQYTFWGYEHLLYRGSLTGTKKTAADGIATQIKATYAAVLLGGMHVIRTEDGGNVTN